MDRCPTCSTDTRSVYHASGGCSAEPVSQGLSFVRKRSVGAKMYKGKQFIGYLKDYSPTGSRLPAADER
jgi:hypothetical protein